jgi:hypothetical protein
VKRDPSITTRDEDELLAQMERFAQHLFENKKDTDILLTLKQFKMLQALMDRRLKYHTVDRNGFIYHLKPDSYREFKLVYLDERKRYTKNNLVALDL